MGRLCRLLSGQAYFP